MCVCVCVCVCVVRAKTKRTEKKTEMLVREGGNNRFLTMISDLWLLVHADQKTHTNGAFGVQHKTVAEK